MKIKGIIFDFGFTLFEFIDVSMDKYFDCFRKGLNKSIEKLKENNLIDDVDTIKEFIKTFNNKRASYFRKSVITKQEFPTSYIFQDILEDEKFNIKIGNKEFYKDLANVFHSFEEDEWVPFENTRETLEKLSEFENIKMAVLSNHPNHVTIINLLKKHDLLKYFDAVVTSAKFGKRKPHPEIFYHTIEKMGLKTADSELCLVCGDEAADIVGGHKAGLQTILCERVYKFPFEKDIEHHDYIKIKDISEILNYIT